MYCTKLRSVSKSPYFVKRLFLAVLACLLIVYTANLYQIYPVDSKTYVIHLNQTGNNIDCHSATVGDALPSAEDDNFVPSSTTIFFHETSCTGGLNSRQACSVESAARANPHRQVVVMFSAPVTRYVLEQSCLAKLQTLDNIKLVRMHITEYAKGTPLESLVHNGTINKSEWRVEHTSDMLRYMSLYKYGGIYLDTDMIVVKSFTSLSNNWASAEDDINVNGAALAMSKDPVGRKIIDSIVSDVAASYRPDLWSYNGPGAVTRNLQKICNATETIEMKAANCRGFEVYDPMFFYPVHYTKAIVYFKPGSLDEQVSKEPYAHHMWNRLTHNLKVEKGSPFQKLAAKHCPLIYEIYGENFGT